MIGWIKLHRTLLEWEWYDDINVKVTFLHLLLSANHAPKKWRGIDIGRGQLWTSISNLSKETGLSEKQIRSSLKKLESTNEIKSKGASKGTMVTVCKYDTYQSIEEQKGEQMDNQWANGGQTEGNQRATNNNDKNIKNEEEGKEETDLSFSDFDIFWKEYNWNTGLRQTQEQWLKIKNEMPSEIPKILVHIPKYIASKPNKDYRKKPENYLKERVWNDEIVMPTLTKGNTQESVQKFIPRKPFYPEQENQ